MLDETHSSGVGRRVAGADDFLPVLIYVLIHANPPQLASNLMYIERFRMHSRMTSESAYFFTQLVGLRSRLCARHSTVRPDWQPHGVATLMAAFGRC